MREDLTQAFELYQKAAERGHAEAQYSLGYMYAYGEHVAKDEKQALFWYRKAAAQGHEKAGRMAKGLEERMGKGRQAGMPHGSQMTAQEAYEKGESFYYGRNGVSRNYADAVAWYRYAAGQGHVWAQYSLGYCYQNGQGVEKNDVEAIKWYRKAADEGNAAAQCSLGSCYYNGQGVARNFSEAVRWYRLAVAQENAYAECNLGLCYEKGQGVPQDYSEAAKWYRKAIANGNQNAKESLDRVEQKIAANLKTNVCDEAEMWLRQAKNYYHGQNGVKKDRVRALECFEKAAELGYVDDRKTYDFFACIFLENGLFAYNGIRRPKNYDEAARWLRLAAKLGVPRAQHTGVYPFFEGGMRLRPMFTGAG